MSKKYFRYLMKSFWPVATVYITLFIICLVVTPFIVDLFCIMLFRMRALSYSTYMAAMGPGCIFLATLLPFIIHSRYYSKNRSDILLSMPMNRGQAFLTEGVFGLALITALLVGGYGIGLGLCNAIGNGYFALGSLDADLVGLPLLFLACVIAFLSSTFAVSVSNSGFQAVVMIILVNILPLFINTLIGGNSFEWYYGQLPNYLSHSEVFESALGAVILEGFNEQSSRLFLNSMIAFACQFIVWGGFAVLGFFEFKKMKSEHLGTVIPQRFGVVNTLTLTALLGFALMTQTVMGEIANGYFYAFELPLFLFSYFIISVIYFVAIFIVRRKAKFRKDDWVRFAIAIVGGIILGAAMYGIVRAIHPISYY